MTWETDPWLILDLETTGLDIETCDVVEVGAVIMDSGEVTAAEGFLVRPPGPIPAEASEIHGITDEMVRDAPPIGDLAPRILALVKLHRVIVGYNGLGYDFPILARLIPGFREACRGKTILDPLIVVRFDSVGRFWRGKGRHRLAEASKRSRLPVEETHRAVGDCTMTGRLLWHWRGELPRDGVEAQRLIVRRKREQDEAFQAWLAKQPPRDDAA